MASSAQDSRLPQWRPPSWGACFWWDASPLNPPPRGWVRKLAGMYLESRYSMTTLMRLSQYYAVKASTARTRLTRAVYRWASAYLRRQNVVLNQFEHGVDPHIAPGVVFHHPGVCITSEAVVEAGVEVYRNVTLGAKNGGAPHIRRGAKIASHAVVLGPVVVGERAIVGAGAVVLEDVPADAIAVGVPARIIGEATEAARRF